MSSYILLIVYIIISRWVVLKTQTPWLQVFIGPILASILLGFMKAEVIPETIWSFLIIFPGALYLAFLRPKRG